MIRSTVGGAIAAAMLSSSALAADFNPIPTVPTAPHISPSLVGYIEIYLGYMGQEFEWDGGSDEDEEVQLGGAARFAHAFGPTFTGQVDLWTESSFLLDSDDDDDVDNFTGLAGHLTHRGLRHQFGVLASVGMVEDQDALMGTVGVEGATTLGHVHLYGQAGYTFGSTSWEDFSVWYVHGRATHYFNPNFRLAADLGYFNGEEDDDGDIFPFDGLRWGAELEGKHDQNSMFSYFARYQGGQIDQEFFGDDEHYTEHLVQVGLRLNFGARTLQERDAAVGLVDYNPFYGANASRLY